MLEDKALLGLSEPPSETTPLELLSDDQLVKRMLAERQKRAKEEKMTLQPLTLGVLWSDFRKNTLGTCKHILFTLDKMYRRFPAAARKTPYRRTGISVHLQYGIDLEQRIGRAHRMGQKRPVQVFVLVTEGTMEENLLTTLSSKHELALAALDTAAKIYFCSQSS